MPHFTFPPTHHMKTPAEFERCYSRKRSASDGLLVVYACENGLTHPRLGCSVSRKVGNAVVRNRYKRLFREAFRLVQHELPAGIDLILIPRPGPYPPLEPLKESVVKLARQAARKLGEGKKPTPPPDRAPPPPKGRGETEPPRAAEVASGAERPTPPVPPSLKGKGEDRSLTLAGTADAPSSQVGRSPTPSPLPFREGGPGGVGSADAGAAP